MVLHDVVEVGTEGPRGLPIPLEPDAAFRHRRPGQGRRAASPDEASGGQRLVDTAVDEHEDRYQRPVEGRGLRHEGK